MPHFRASHNDQPGERNGRELVQLGRRFYSSAADCDLSCAEDGAKTLGELQKVTGISGGALRRHLVKRTWDDELTRTKTDSPDTLFTEYPDSDSR